MSPLFRRKNGKWVPIKGGTSPVDPPPPPPGNQAPNPPASLGVVTTTTTAVLTWPAATDPDGSVVSYQVQINGTTVATPTALTYTATALTPGTAYTFSVRAVDNNGAVSTPVAQDATTATATPPATVSHGREITSANTGHLAYYDSSLGRTVTDSDLTVHTGLVSMSDFVGNNGVLAKHWFKGGLIADRTNVTIRACKFDGGMSGYYAGVDHQFNIEWSTINSPGAAGDDGLHYGSYTAYRCNIQGQSDGGKTNGNVTITECYIRTKMQDGEDHNDGLQNDGGAGPVTVMRCNIDARPVNFGSFTGSGGPNAALFVADGANGLQTWYDNLLGGGVYVMRLYGDTGYTKQPTFDVQGNQVIQSSIVSGGGPAARAVIPASSVTWGTLRPNVLVNDSGAVLSTIPAP